MKKFLIMLGIMVLTTLSASAKCDEFTCPVNAELSNSFSRGLSNITGTTFLATKTAQSILKSQIKKEAEGDFDVRIKAYSLPDLKAGRFKSLEITGKNVVTDDVYLSLLKLKTLCDYNYIVYDKKNQTATFKEDFGMSFATTITEEDLNNTMNANGYKTLIEEINSMGRNYNLFNITRSKAKLRDNKFMYVFQVRIPLLNTKQNIIVSSDVNILKGKIYLSHTKVLNNFFSVDLSNLSYIINYLNPLSFTLGILENKDATLTVEDAVIKDNRIDIGGKIIVLKDVVTECKD